jgi:hypothetical protein
MCLNVNKAIQGSRLLHVSSSRNLLRRVVTVSEKAFYLLEVDAPDAVDLDTLNLAFGA